MLKARAIVIAFVSLLALPAWARDRHYAILPVSEARAAIDQCSRTAPEHVTTFWLPTPSQVEAAQRALPAYLRTTGEKITRRKIVLREFFRQYVGVVVRGKRLMYLNAFPAPAPRSADARDAQVKAYVVCDGGSSFWGAEFDPATNTFNHFDWNGVA
jgi:hypothetical protein